MYVVLLFAGKFFLCKGWVGGGVGGGEGGGGAVLGLLKQE